MTRLQEAFERNPIASPLATIDPRQLPQAWRSALGLAHRNNAGHDLFRRTSNEGGPHRRRERPQELSALRPVTFLGCKKAPRARDGHGPEPAFAAGVRPRARATPLATRVAAETSRPQPARRTTFVLRGRTGAIYVLVQGAGARPRVAVARGVSWN